MQSVSQNIADFKVVMQHVDVVYKDDYKIKYTG